MQNHHFIASLTAVAVTIAMAGTMSAGFLPAHAQALAEASAGMTSLSAAEKKRPIKRRKAKKSNDGRQIACTVYGCHPIPRNCHPEIEFDWQGNPTSYDAIVCR